MTIALRNLYVRLYVPHLYHRKFERVLHTKARPTFRQASGTTSGHASTAEQKYTPAVGASRVSGNNIEGSQPESSAGTMQSAPGTSRHGYASSPSGFQQNKKMWVVFGVQGPRMTLELDQIGNNDLQSDRVFLREIRRKHHLLRGRLRSYFSFWQLSYWEFVKVSVSQLS